MNLSIFQVDVFANKPFRGNPAAVVPLNKWLPSELMQNIAMENNLSETAFICPSGKRYKIRWFTPFTEVNLCGHATIAAAHVLLEHLNYQKNEIIFESKSEILTVKKNYNMLLLNFPAVDVEEIDIPENLVNAFSSTPVKCYKGGEDHMLVFKNESEIWDLNPDFNAILKTKTRGIICTAASKDFDFISRFFAPALGINEDPVTGSTHTVLIPYWSKKLKKTELVANQASPRGGMIYCLDLNDRVEIGGNAITYLSGSICI